MTTSSFGYTTYPSEGDTSLDPVDTTDAAAYSDGTYTAGGGGTYDAMVGASIKSSGTGTGQDGGFDIGQHTAFDGDGSTDGARWVVLNSLDTTKLDTMVVTAIRGNDTNGGEDPDDTGEGLVLYYQMPGMTDYIPIDYYPTLDAGDYKGGQRSIIPIGKDDSGLKDWSIPLPDYARGEGARFLLYQIYSSGDGYDNFGITKISYRRKTPISVVVSLDSPDASVFMRVGQGSQKTDPRKRKKKTEEQLRAGEKYTDKAFGTKFPGSTTTLETQPETEGSPLGKGQVAKKFGAAPAKAFDDYRTQADLDVKSQRVEKLLSDVGSVWQSAETMADLDTPEVINNLNDAIESDPDNYLARWYRSHVNNMKGDLEGEIEDLAKLQQLYPDEPDSKERLNTAVEKYTQQAAEIARAEEEAAAEAARKAEEERVAREKAKSEAQKQATVDELKSITELTDSAAIDNWVKSSQPLPFATRGASRLTDEQQYKLFTMDKIAWAKQNVANTEAASDAKGNIYYWYLNNAAKYYEDNWGGFYNINPDSMTDQEIDQKYNRIVRQLQMKLRDYKSGEPAAGINALIHAAKLLKGHSLDPKEDPVAAPQVEDTPKVTPQEILDRLEKQFPNIKTLDQIKREAYIEMAMLAVETGLDAYSLISSILTLGGAAVPNQVIKKIGKVAFRKLVDRLIGKVKTKSKPTTKIKKKNEYGADYEIDEPFVDPKKQNKKDRLRDEIDQITTSGGEDPSDVVTALRNAYGERGRDLSQKLSDAIQDYDSTLVRSLMKKAERLMRGSDVNKVSKSSTKKIDPYGDQSGHTQWSTQRSVGGYQGNSYEPQGTSLMEKKLKKPKQFFNQADIKPIYPDEAPPETVNGWHPEYGKVANRFNKLDPISARAMPATGDPEIDAKVKAAAKKPKLQPASKKPKQA